MTHQEDSAALNDLTALIIESSSHRVRARHHGHSILHGHEPSNADRTGACPSGRVSSGNHGSSRLRQRIEAKDPSNPKRKRGRSSFRGSARCSVARRSRPRNELRPLFLPWSEIHHPPAQFAPSGSLQTKPFHRAKACFFSFTHMARDLRIDCFMSRGSIAVLSQRSLGPLLSSSFVHPPRGGPWHCATGSFLTRPTPSPICSAVGAYPAAADHAAVVRHSPAWPRKRSSRGR